MGGWEVVGGRVFNCRKCLYSVDKSNKDMTTMTLILKISNVMSTPLPHLLIKCIDKSNKRRNVVCLGETIVCEREILVGSF